jgi:hypothetical protein
LQHQVVLMPDGVVWYRVHDEQIDFNRRNDPFLRFRYFLVTLQYLSKDCPLSPEQKDRVIGETRKAMAREIMISFFLHSPRKAAQMYREAGFRFGRFAGYCMTITLGKLPFLSSRK